nr:hypothetical protein [Dietzia sp. WMMA184]
MTGDFNAGPSSPAVRALLSDGVLVDSWRVARAGTASSGAPTPTTGARDGTAPGSTGSSPLPISRSPTPRSIRSATRAGGPRTICRCTLWCTRPARAMRSTMGGETRREDSEEPDGRDRQLPAPRRERIPDGGGRPAPARRP